MAKGTMTLLDLQTIDLESRQLEQAASGYPLRLKEIEDDLGAHRTSSDQKQGELDEIESQRKVIESQIQGQKDQIRKWESRLSDIKTPREYAALSREIDIAKKGIRNQEEEILNLMEQAEALQGEVEVIERTILEKEQGYEAERAELKDKLSAMEKERLDIDTRRRAVVEGIDPSLLSTYERIRVRRGGVAMAAVRPGGNCEACRMRIPPQVYNELVTGTGGEIMQCPSCHRILYVPEESDENGDDSAHDAGVAHT